MYSLDINLLRERAEYQTGQQPNFTSDTTVAPVKYSKVPLFAGIGVAALALLASGGGWWWLGQQTSQLEAKQKDLDQKLGSLQAQDQRLKQLNGQVTQITDETHSFASVFNQIQPWSAVLQDLRESIPQGVQIGSIIQTEVKSGVPAPSAAVPAPVASGGGLAAKISTPPNPEAKPTPSPSPAAAATAAPPAVSVPAAVSTAAGVATLPAEINTTKLQISGIAKSFDEVNNFILTLKQSAFFNPDETQLVAAAATPGFIASGDANGQKSIIPDRGISSTQASGFRLPPVVAYKIITSIKRTPSTDMMRELERKGAVGLVTRLKSLQQQQIIKSGTPQPQVLKPSLPQPQVLKP
jgi:type IV pilus assembly protein PilN